MAAIDERRLNVFYQLDEADQNKIEEVILKCQKAYYNITAFSNGSLLSANVEAFLGYSCDACDVQDVLPLWDVGVCDFPPRTTFNICVYVFYIAILIVAVIGNFLVVYVVWCTSKLRTVTNYFIVNLAVGDLFMAIFCVPFSFLSTLILQYWPFGFHLCIIVNYLQAVSVFVSAYTLVAISLDRYLAIIYPLRPRMTRLQSKLIILVVWLLSLTTTLPVAVFSDLSEPPPNFYQVHHLEVCQENWGKWKHDAGAMYSATLMLLQYFLPIFVLIFTYSRIAIVVWGKRNLGETPAARVDRLASGKKKMIQMMVTVVLVYTFCWLPFNILMVARSFSEYLDHWEGMMYLWAFFHWLAMSHACYNPIILCWMNTKFRTGFCCAFYHVPCLRRWVDSWFFCPDPEDQLGRAGTITSCSRPRNRLVTISLKDDTIIFKSRNVVGKSLSPGYNCRRFLQMLEETSSESPL